MCVNWRARRVIFVREVDGCVFGKAGVCAWVKG